MMGPEHERGLKGPMEHALRLKAKISSSASTSRHAALEKRKHAVRLVEHCDITEQPASSVEGPVLVREVRELI